MRSFMLKVLLATALCSGPIVMGVAAQPAAAACFGVNSGGQALLYNPSTFVVIARETYQTLSTCNRDTIYAGKLQDPVSDGSCAYVYFDDGSYYGLQATECTTGAYQNYAYYDVNGDWYSQINLGTTYWLDGPYVSQDY